jgi:hypothetical protein
MLKVGPQVAVDDETFTTERGVALLTDWPSMGKQIKLPDYRRETSIASGSVAQQLGRRDLQAIA